MTTTMDYRPVAYLIILLGAGGAAAASVVPFYNAGYKLDTTALLAVLAPFILYSMLIESLRGGWRLAAGLGPGASDRQPGGGHTRALPSL